MFVQVKKDIHVSIFILKQKLDEIDKIDSFQSKDKIDQIYPT